MKSIQTITILLLITISFKSNGQDLHFSQFWNSPLLHNPSFAGKSDGDLRAIVNYRSQWGSVTTNPFKTFGANVDMRINSSAKDNFFAGGISMYTDVAGESKMRTTLVNLAAAYHLKVNDQNYISGGLQAGINQKSIDGSELRFDNQFDGEGHNPILNSNEVYTNLSEIKPAVSAGISYMWSNAFGKTTTRTGVAKKKINVGLAVHHFNSPSFNFADQERLGTKYIANMEGSFETPSYPWTIRPAMYLVLQNKATNIVLGSLFEYTIDQEASNKSASIGFGAYYRFGDAFIPAVQVKFASFDIGFSYDVNASELSGASSGYGAYEVSLKFNANNSALGRTSRARYF